MAAYASDVSPSLAMDDVAHGLMAYSELPSNASCRSAHCPEFPNFADFFSRQFCHAVFFANVPATLFLHIVHVVLMAAKEKVRWFYAGWIITMMTNEERFIEYSIGELVGYTVSFCNKFSAIADTPITAFVLCSRPQNTIAMRVFFGLET